VEDEFVGPKKWLILSSNLWSTKCSWIWFKLYAFLWFV